MVLIKNLMNYDLQAMDYATGKVYVFKAFEEKLCDDTMDGRYGGLLRTVQKTPEQRSNTIEIIDSIYDGSADLKKLYGERVTSPSQGRTTYAIDNTDILEALSDQNNVVIGFDQKIEVAQHLKLSEKNIDNVIETLNTMEQADIKEENKVARIKKRKAKRRKIKQKTIENGENNQSISI